MVQYLDEKHFHKSSTTSSCLFEYTYSAKQLCKNKYILKSKPYYVQT